MNGRVAKRLRKMVDDLEVRGTDAWRRKYQAMKKGFDMTPCKKESMGYNCHHRRYANGMLECDGSYEKN